MVRIYDIKGSDADVKAQHDKCDKCKGSITDCLKFIKCSHAACSKQFHVACLQHLTDSNELSLVELWYCSHDCDDADEASRNSSMAAKVKQLEKELNKMRVENESLTKSNQQINSSFKRLESQLAESRASSTLAWHGTNVADATLDSSSIYNAANLDSTINHLLERSSMLQAPQPSQSQTSSQPTQSSSSSSATMSSNETQSAHAVASIIMSLSERRKHLPELPEFSGKGSEWLCFRNSYHKIKTMGRYDDDEMIAKLRKALKGPAFEYARMWLFSARPNPSQVISDLEEKFFCPSAVITDSFDAISAVPAIKEKSRSAIEKFKRAVDEYMNVCNDVEETIHLTGRVPEIIEDKLPDDLLEDWIKKIHDKEFRGDWYNFSSFLTDSMRHLKVRAIDRKRVKGSSVKVNVLTSKPTFHGEAPICDYDLCGKVLFRCENFAKQPYHTKMGHVTLKGYCALCLRKGHDPRTCPNAKAIPHCRLKGCTEPEGHTTLMHPPECSPRPS